MVTIRASSHVLWLSGGEWPASSCCHKWDATCMHWFHLHCWSRLEPQDSFFPLHLPNVWLGGADCIFGRVSGSGVQQSWVFVANEVVHAAGHAIRHTSAYTVGQQKSEDWWFIFCPPCGRPAAPHGHPSMPLAFLDAPSFPLGPLTRYTVGSGHTCGVLHLCLGDSGVLPWKYGIWLSAAPALLVAGHLPRSDAGLFLCTKSFSTFSVAVMREKSIFLWKIPAQFVWLEWPMF